MSWAKFFLIAKFIYHFNKNIIISHFFKFNYNYLFRFFIKKYLIFILNLK